jgi:hypothetical protein
MHCFLCTLCCRHVPSGKQGCRSSAGWSMPLQGRFLRKWRGAGIDLHRCTCVLDSACLVCVLCYNHPQQTCSRGMY